MKLTELKGRQEVLADHLQDPASRERWEKTALAHAVVEDLTIAHHDVLVAGE
jgi:hypothetical protein